MTSRHSHTVSFASCPNDCTIPSGARSAIAYNEQLQYLTPTVPFLTLDAS